MNSTLTERIDYKENKLYGSLRFQVKTKQIKEEDPIPTGPITPLTTWLKVQLRDAWKEEVSFKTFLNDFLKERHETLESNIKDINS